MKEYEFNRLIFEISYILNLESPIISNIIDLYKTLKNTESH